MNIYTQGSTLIVARLPGATNLGGGKYKITENAPLGKSQSASISIISNFSDCLVTSSYIVTHHMALVLYGQAIHFAWGGGVPKNVIALTQLPPRFDESF